MQLSIIFVTLLVFSAIAHGESAVVEPGHSYAYSYLGHYPNVYSSVHYNALDTVHAPVVHHAEPVVPVVHHHAPVVHHHEAYVAPALPAVHHHTAYVASPPVAPVVDEIVPPAPVVHHTPVVHHAPGVLHHRLV